MLGVQQPRRGNRSVSLPTLYSLLPAAFPPTVALPAESISTSLTISCVRSRSPACILKHYAAERDRTQLIVNEVEIDSTGKATIGWKAVGSRE